MINGATWTKLLFAGECHRGDRPHSITHPLPSSAITVFWSGSLTVLDFLSCLPCWWHCHLEGRVKGRSGLRPAAPWADKAEAGAEGILRNHGIVAAGDLVRSVQHASPSAG